MTAICKNCDNTFEGNFCNNCGQSKDTHKLSMHYIWHDLQHGIFHFDNGIFYTIKNLLTKPGVSIREFIEGKESVILTLPICNCIGYTLWPSISQFYR